MTRSNTPRRSGLDRRDRPLVAAELDAADARIRQIRAKVDRLVDDVVAAGDPPQSDRRQFPRAITVR